MASLSEGHVNLLCEKLIKTVSRAFYTDGVVVVLDALIREKFVREEELGPRLRLQDKFVRSIVNKLEEEFLVSSESILMPDLRQSKCYYIDYQLFVDMVRYRVHLMDKAVNSSQNDEINETKYKCPTCAKEVGALDAQKCKSKDYKFICTSCCPHENFRELMAEPYYRLIALDPTNKLRNAQSLKTKLIKAMQSCVEHDGIYDMLRDLKDATIKRNLPSENMGRGFRNSEVLDEDKKQAILDNLGRPVLSKKNRYLVMDDTAKKESGISVELNDNDNSVVVASGVDALGGGAGTISGLASDGSDPAAKRMRMESRVPEFLDRSGVYGSSSVYQLESLQAQPQTQTQAQTQIQAQGAAEQTKANEGQEEAGGIDEIDWEDAGDDDD